MISLGSESRNVALEDYYFLPITFELTKLEQKMQHHLDPLVDTHRNIYIMN